MATKAYILIKVKAGKTKDVVKALKTIAGVHQVHPCFGQPDIFSFIEVQDEKDFDPLSEVPGLKKMSPFVILAVALVLLWLFSPFVIVGAGERGVVFNQLHGVEDKILSEGFSFIIPIVERVIKMDVRIRKSDTRSTGASKDLQTVATESKQTAEQLALKAQRDLERVKIEGQQKIVQAKAEAESQRIQKETISPIILQLRAIEKWDGKFPQVIGGSGALPFINIDAGSTRK